MTTITTIANETKQQIINRRLGLWLFMISESFLFLGFLIARYYMQGLARPSEINQILGLTITVVLLVSSFFANRAEVQMKFGDQVAFLRNILITIVLGIVFLLGVVIIEWPEALHFAPPATGFGTALFSLTGLHAFHVLTGVIVLTLVYLKGRKGHYTAENHWDVEGSVVYWHFIDVIWIVIYPTLYLVGS